MRIAVGVSTLSTLDSLLMPNGIELIPNPFGRKLTEEELIAHLQGADGLLAGLESLNRRVFEACPNLKAIARVGIGIDNVDLEAAAEFDIKVSNTPDEPTQAVAEMTLAALLAIGRQIIPANADMHDQIWKKRLGFSLQGLNVLIIGYGRIGQMFGKMLRQFGAKVVIHDINRADISTALSIALPQADVVSLHVSGVGQIIGRDEIELMRDGVVILNSARGTLIDEDALYHGLRSDKIQAYWGDVFWEEPYTGKLTECENAVLTPHISTYSRQCREQMEKKAFANLLADLGPEEGLLQG